MPVAQPGTEHKPPKPVAKGSNPFGHTSDNMKFIRSLLTRVANMSKASLIAYCIITTVLFFASASMFLTGVIFLPPNENTIEGAIPLTIAGGVILAVLLFSVLFVTLASNYGKNKSEDQRAEVEREGK